jgi:hypothetical protein
MSGNEKIEIPGTVLYLRPAKGHIHGHVGWRMHVTEDRWVYTDMSPSADAVRQVLTGHLLENIQIAWDRFGKLVEHLHDAGLMVLKSTERMECDLLLTLLRTICHEAIKAKAASNA